MEKIWTVPELKGELGPYYIAAIMREDSTLTRPKVFNALNGREAGMDLMEKVMEAADKAVVTAKRLKEIKAQLTAHKITPTSNAA